MLSKRKEKKYTLSLRVLDALLAKDVDVGSFRVKGWSKGRCRQHMRRLQGGYKQAASSVLKLNIGAMRVWHKLCSAGAEQSGMSDVLCR